MKKKTHNCEIEVKGTGEGQVLLIDGKKESYNKLEDGYILSRNAYANPLSTLEEAADETLGREMDPGADTVPETAPEPEPQPTIPDVSAPPTTTAVPATPSPPAAATPAPAAPAAPAVAVNLRSDFISLGDNEKARLGAAFNQLFTDGVIKDFADAHETLFVNGIHRGPAFLPWHRWYLLQLEGKLKAIDNTLTLPYWDWSQLRARSLATDPFKSFFGDRSNSGGLFGHWNYNRRSGPAGWVLPNLDRVLDDINVNSYVDFRDMEFKTHVPGHTWTGGTMSSGTSPADPLFYFHHCMVDRMWAIWQLNNPQVDQYNQENRTSDGRTLSTYPGRKAFVLLNDDMVTGNLAAPATPKAMLTRTYNYPKDARMETQAAQRGMANFISGDV